MTIIVPKFLSYFPKDFATAQKRVHFIVMFLRKPSFDFLEKVYLCLHLKFLL